MPNIPNLTIEDITALIPQCENVRPVGQGGQKVVFRAAVNGQDCVLKFAAAPDELDDVGDVVPDDVVIRARREVETLRDCGSNHLVKLGPVDFGFGKVGDQQLLYFSEEFIPGGDLREQARKGEGFGAQEVTQLGIDMADAIDGLWSLGKIHRDIKPGNVMRRSSGEFVLLDAGLAFDLAGESLSIGVVGTPLYFSPEQFDFAGRRDGLDFRSDLFSLGVTMYEMLAGVHPFYQRGQLSNDLMVRILEHDPAAPSSFIEGEDHPGLDAVILRLLRKKPHLRYRRIQQVSEALQNL